jgi:polyribonucleotide nucleotidyltransferase
MPQQGIHQVSVEIGGREMRFETGKMARQAHGAVVVRYGDSTVLATACMDNKAT